MSNASFERQKSIFLDAIEIASPNERLAYLDQKCGKNEALRAEVEALLQAHEKSGDLFDKPAAPQPTLDLPPTSEGPGTTIGRYKLLQRIGEGGFGVVFMAQQLEPVKRKVALKIIKPGMDTKEVIGRFEAERQALALMEHPNIARVLDGDTTESGRPFFVMELVRGVPITEYCDENNLTPAERLRLFISVCQAVQHAHQKGIIHRDIKPTNVLVTLHDDGPVVKVIDFGVAKAIGRELTEKTLFTRFEQMVGTPLYMSPEQAEMRSLDVDTRSDIYSLGVLLYELLTGVTPFDRWRLREAALDEIRRIIREEEPLRPSHRISTLGDTLRTVSEHRRTEPNRLSAIVRGDLDWIVMKSLEKDRNRRYETAKDLATDIERHLNHQPIEARRPSLWYRSQKFCRRNRVPLTTSAAIATTLLIAGGVVGTLALERHTNAVLRLGAQAKQELIAGNTSEAARIYRDLIPEYEGKPKEQRALLGNLEDVATQLVADENVEGAIPILEDVVAGYNRLLGEDDARTHLAAKKLSAACYRVNLDIIQRIDAPAERYALAVKLARREIELDIKDIPQRSTQWLRLAIAYYRERRFPDAVEAIQRSCSTELGSRAQLLVMALSQWRMNETKAARDWSRASVDPLQPEGLLGLAEELSPEVEQLMIAIEVDLSEEWTSEQYVELYTHLLETQPSSLLHHNLGTHHVVLNDWKSAAREFHDAAMLDPKRTYYWRACAVLSLMAGDVDGYTEICHEAFRRLENGQYYYADHLVAICCLYPESNAKRGESKMVMSEVFDKSVDRALTRGMLAYRRDRFDAALNSLPAMDTNEKTSAVTLAFQAMAFHRLGKSDEAHAILNRARVAKQDEIPTPVGPLSDTTNRPVTWCEVQLTLREAEQLIEGPASVGASTMPLPVEVRQSCLPAESVVHTECAEPGDRSVRRHPLT